MLLWIHDKKTKNKEKKNNKTVGKGGGGGGGGSWMPVFESAVLDEELFCVG